MNLRKILAFAAVYIIWGSTYLAIRFAIETIPPFLMAGTRFLIAGGLLYAWARLRGAGRPSLRHWRSGLIVGGLMLLGGNGGVTWAEQRISSGLAALLIATVPMWMALLEALPPNRMLPTRRALPTRRVLFGLGLGILGVALLIGPSSLLDSEAVDLLGALAVIGGALAWALGSLYSRHAELPDSPLQGIALEMLGGGALLLLAGSLSGEWGRLDLQAVSAGSLLALGYLVLFGSIVAFSAYIWLLKHTSPARAATYAYVNPVVAVWLGWALADEPLTALTLLAAAVIIAGVALINTGRIAEQK